MEFNLDTDNEHSDKYSSTKKSSSKKVFEAFFFSEPGKIFIFYDYTTYLQKNPFEISIILFSTIFEQKI